MTTTTKAKAKKTDPPEWENDIQFVKSGGDKEHGGRDCWCGPRLVSLPHIVKGSPDAIDTVEVRHR